MAIFLFVKNVSFPKFCVDTQVLFLIEYLFIFINLKLKHVQTSTHFKRIISSNISMLVMFDHTILKLTKKSIKQDVYILHTQREREITWYKGKNLYPTNGSSYEYNMTCSLPKC